MQKGALFVLFQGFSCGEREKAAPILKMNPV